MTSPYPNWGGSGCLRLFVYPLAIACLGLGVWFLGHQTGGFLFASWLFLASLDVGLLLVIGVEYLSGNHKPGDGSKISKTFVTTGWAGFWLLAALLFLVLAPGVISKS